MTTREDANPAPAVTTAGAMVPSEPGRMGAVVGRPYSERTTFAAGDLLQERFKILRFIAQGGAGEVYEAHDLELRCPVALKVVRREVAENERAIERFRREIALARQVTHPNVCRIFDVFRHELPPESPGGEPVQSLFLTMELLVGESLAAHIHRHGPMSEEECLPLVDDMVAGLTAAHRAGVIHRDFKSANVMLARDATGLRAVVTDFGLARAQDPDDPAPLTHTGTVVGTPNYMAPEQLTGEEVGPGVDTYALGIVMYEMVTGKRPFRGETDLSTAVKRLTEKPASPRLLAPELASNWEEAILRCLEREPENRFVNLADLVGFLAGKQELPPTVKKRELPSKTFWVAATGIGLFVLLSAALLFASLRSQPNESSVALLSADETTRKPRIAVLSVRNLSGSTETQWLSSALAEMMAVEMEIPGDVEMLRPEDVRAAASELELDMGQSLGRESVSLLRRQLGVDLLLEASYLARATQDTLRLNLRLHGDTEPQVVTVEGSQSQLVETVDEVTTQVRRDLGIDRVASGEELDAESRLLQVAQSALANGDLMTARQVLLQVLETRPDHLETQMALARTHLLLGELALARKAAVLATQISRGASREMQLLAQGHRALIERDHADAAEIFLSLHRFFPGKSDYAFLLAETLAAADAADRGLEVLDAIETEALTPVAHARLALLKAKVGAETERSSELVTEAVYRTEIAGAGTLLAHARVLQAQSQLGEGRAREAREALLLAERRFREERLEPSLALVLDLRADAEARLGGTAQVIDTLRREAASLRG